MVGRGIPARVVESAKNKNQDRLREARSSGAELTADNAYMRASLTELKRA